MEEKRNGMSSAALVLAILAIIFSFIPYIDFISIIMGILSVIFALVTIKTNKGKAIASLIISILAIIISVAMINTASNAIDKTSKEIDKNLNDATGKNTDEILKNDVNVSFGTFNVTDKGYGLKDTSLDITVTNKSSKKQSYYIHIEAVDSNGSRIKDDYVTINDLASGQSMTEKAFEYVSSDEIDAMKSATFKVVEISKL